MKGIIEVLGQSVPMMRANSRANSVTPKIKWQRLPGLKLQAYTDDVAPRGYERGLNESDMNPIQAWSVECRCGTRISFNIWKFKNEKQITMFLIRWS
jgi:hypothetical protein